MPATIKDIAKAAKVSRSTVSRVLNDSGYVKEETRTRVLAVIEELNYSPSAIARSLSNKRSNTIGVIVPDINNPFFAEMIKGVTRVADEEGYRLLLVDTDEDNGKEQLALQALQEQRIEGLLIVSTPAKGKRSLKHLRWMRAHHIPVVLLDGHIKYDEFDGVFIDHYQGAHDATIALIKAGHKRVGILTGKLSSRPAMERLRGFQDAMAECGVVSYDEDILFGDYGHEKAYHLTKEMLLREKRPSALFVSSNQMVLGMMRAMSELGMKIPQDLAFIGFDQLETLNLIGMNCSTVDAHTVEVGELSMKRLIRRLENEKLETTHTVLRPDLSLRGSEANLK